MEIIESWQDAKENYYAIVRYSMEEQKEFHNKEYEALWMMGNGILWWNRRLSDCRV
jgi:hypothetical protein